MHLHAWKKGGAWSAFFCGCFLAGCAWRTGHIEPASSDPALPSSPASPGWGIDACITRHVDDEEFRRYLTFLSASDVRILRERDIGTRQPDGSYDRDVRDKLRAEKAAGFRVVAFGGPVNHPRVAQVGDTLPENLLDVFEGGRLLARDFAGLVDAWEMVGEPDVGYCTDLPERVAAYQKALYLGIKAGANEAEGGDRGAALELSTHNAQPSTAQAPLVLMGALALPPGPWLERAVRNGLLDYTDAYNFHFYGHAGDLAGVIAAHERVARLGASQPTGQKPEAGPSDHPASVVRPPSPALPLWITECGLNAVPSDDFLNTSRRELQAKFTVETAGQALGAAPVAVYMPFILVGDKIPQALTLSARQTLPAWTAYARFMQEHPWPLRRAAAPPPAPNPIVLQWMPDNATTQAHKMSGSYRFLGARSIAGELKIYNFSDRPVHGRLVAGPLQQAYLGTLLPDGLDVAPKSCRALPVAFRRTNPRGYLHEEWSADFADDAGRKSSVSFALETTPEDEADDFIARALPLASPGGRGSVHRFDPGDEVTTRATVWQGVNGLQLKELPAANDTETALQIRTSESRRDPLRARLAVARLKGGLPSAGFVRLRLDRPMDGNFWMCVDLVDRRGQRFTIWENAGVSYFHPKATDVWLNLADFTPYFWGRCTADPRLHPADLEEIQLRFYISKTDDPRTVALSFMTQRER